MNAVELLIAAARRDLAQKGFREGIINHAITRATKTAERLSQRLSPAIRDQGYLDLLRFELDHAEQWCQGVWEAANIH